MKTFTLSVVLGLIFTATAPAHASYLRMCNFKATVLSLSKVATLNERVVSLPDQTFTYNFVVTFKILDATDVSDNQADCNFMVGTVQSLVVRKSDPKRALLKADAEIELDHRYYDDWTKDGVAQGEQWTLK